MNVTDQKCIDYARECMRLAQFADKDPELQKHLLQIAREWMAVASPADRQIPHGYDSYRLYGSYGTLEEAIAALEDMYATGEVQPRIEHHPGELFSYVITIGRKTKSGAESCLNA